MSKARELAELSRTVSDSADAVAITIDSSENVTFANDIDVTGTTTTANIITDEDQSGLLTLGRFSSGFAYSLIRPSTNATGLEIRTFAGNALARFLNTGVTELYHNGAAKLATASTGIAVTGDITISSAGPSITLTDTDNNPDYQIKNGNGSFRIIDTTNSEDRITINTSGNVGIGTSSISAKLHVVGSPQATSGALAFLRNSDATASNTTFGGVLFSSSPGTDFSIGKSNVNAATSLSFRNGNTGASLMDLDSSGNLLVGVTSTTIPGVGNTTAGVSIRGDDGSFFSRSLGSGDTNNVVSINRSTAEGPILGFQKDGTTIGRIGVVATNNLFINGDAIGVGIGDDNVYPTNSSGASTNGDTDLGDASARWRDLFLSGGVNFNGSSGGISTANRSFLMDEYEIGTCTIGFNTSTGNATLSRLDNTTGFYQKTGDICTVHFYSGGMTFSGAGTGQARITGLPFNSKGGTYNYGVCSITHNTVTTTDIQNGYSAPNNNFIILVQRHATAPTSFRTSGVRYFMFSITYLTA